MNRRRLILATLAVQTKEKAMTHVPVLVVGGGLTGLASAVFLAWHGVACTLVERHADLLIHPRLRGIDPRTVELFRQIGIEPAIRSASYADGDQTSWIPVLADTLAGEHTVAEEPEDDDDDDSTATGDASPCTRGAINQDKLEILLRDKAKRLGADIRFSTEVTSFSDDDTQIVASLRDVRTGVETTVTADYLIAADGYASAVRERLGIGVEGPGPLVHMASAVIDADLTPALRGRRVSVAYLQLPRPYTALMAHDDAGCSWVFGIAYDPEHESVSDYTDDYVARLVREAAGIPDAPVTLRPQIPNTDLKVLSFTIGAQVAERYRAGRVFLVGDAAHVMPPTGGFGGNTGIQDAHNLAWKLAAVLHRQAGVGLLDTYDVERRPVGQLAMQQALARFAARMGPVDAPAALVPYDAVVFGYRYRSAAVLGPDSDTSPLVPHRLVGQPGTRAPHSTVHQNGTSISTIDLHGRHFVLLTGDQGLSWVAAADRAADRTRVPIDAYRVGVDLTGTAATDRIGPRDALLIRPDGVVAWRAPQETQDPDAALQHALNRVLALR